MIRVWDRMVDWAVTRLCWLWGHEVPRGRTACMYCGKDQA